MTGAGYLAWRTHRPVEELLNEPSILIQFEQAKPVADVAMPKKVDSPLVVQAQALAHHFDPPEVVSPKPISMPTMPRKLAASTTKGPVPRPKLPVVRPPVSSPKFRLLATGYYPSEPQLSVALINEPGGAQRWVKAGDRVGHLLIVTVGKRCITYRDGARIGELAIEEDKKKPQPHTKVTARILR